MAEIVSSVPEITPADDVNQPLLLPPPVSVPAPSGGRDTASPRVPMLLGLFSGRRRSSSFRVRQNVALELEDLQEDWAYSLPVVVLGSLWHVLLVAVSVVTMFWIAREERNVKLRVWICGYAVLCVVCVVMLLVEYKRRNRRMFRAPVVSTGLVSLSSTASASEDDFDHVAAIRKWEMINTVISYIWWVVGLVLMLFSYDKDVTPCLFRLTLAFLAIDVFFLVLRSLILCLLSVSYWSCLPCIIAIMCYISGQELESETNISNLPKYIFEAANGDVEQPDARANRLIPMGPNGPDFSPEGVLLTEDANCCMCLSRYEDGEQLHLLSCTHHFHSACVKNWLRVKAACPLCKSFVA